jgi:hypothetical protein
VGVGTRQRIQVPQPELLDAFFLSARYLFGVFINRAYDHKFGEQNVLTAYKVHIKSTKNKELGCFGITLFCE